MKIGIFSGSARPARKSHQVAVEIKKRLESQGYHCWMFDVLEENLPLLGHTFSADPDPGDQLKRLSNSIATSDGFIIVSPEYNGSYSGALKNSMDYFYKEYAHKAFGIVGVSSGMLGGINAVRSLEFYVQRLNGILYPSPLITPKVQTLFEEGKLIDTGYSERIDKFLSGYLWLAEVLSKDKRKI